MQPPLMSKLTDANAVWTLDGPNSDLFLLTLALNLIDKNPPRATPQSALQGLYDRQMEFYPAMMKKVEEQMFPDTSSSPNDPEMISDWEYTVTRLMFQYRQHQFAQKILVPAMEANDGQWSRMEPLIAEFAPRISPALESEEIMSDPQATLDNIAEVEMSSDVTAVMFTTVRKAHEELGLGFETVYQHWMEMNQQVDSRTLQRKVQLYLEWCNNGQYPPTVEELMRVFKTEQQRIVNQVIHEELTEPIIAKP